MCRRCGVTWSQILDVDEGYMAGKFNGHKGVIHTVLHMSSFHTLLSAGADRSIRVWDLRKMYADLAVAQREMAEEERRLQAENLLSTGHSNSLRVPGSRTSHSRSPSARSNTNSLRVDDGRSPHSRTVSTASSHGGAGGSSRRPQSTSLSPSSNKRSSSSSVSSREKGLRAEDL